MEKDGKQGRLRSMSDPTGMFEMDTDEKKCGGVSHFFHKLPFLLGKHRHHNSHSQSDNEFCDIETEMRKAKKHEKFHQHVHKTDRNEKKHQYGQGEMYTEDVVVMVNDSTDAELDHRKDDEDDLGKEKDRYEAIKLLNSDADENGLGDTNNIKRACCSSESNLASDEDGSHGRVEEPLHDPPLSPLPPPCRSCLKDTSCTFSSGDFTKLPPLRKRSISVPAGDPNIIFRLNRHVHFSPDTVEPTPRNCKYREWIETHSNHGSVKLNIKHEKRMQQLRQIHSLDINDYLSKGHQRYHNAMVSSPMPSLGCDVFM